MFGINFTKKENKNNFNNNKKNNTGINNGNIDNSISNKEITKNSNNKIYNTLNIKMVNKLAKLEIRKHKIQCILKKCSICSKNQDELFNKITNDLNDIEIAKNTNYNAILHGKTDTIYNYTQQENRLTDYWNQNVIGIAFKTCEKHKKIQYKLSNVYIKITTFQKILDKIKLIDVIK